MIILSGLSRLIQTFDSIKLYRLARKKKIQELLTAFPNYLTLIDNSALYSSFNSSSH